MYANPRREGTKPTSFQWCPRKGTRGVGRKLKYMQFPLNIRNYFFFTLRVTEHCHRLPKGGVESPSLENIRCSLDMVLSKWLSLGGPA